VRPADGGGGRIVINPADLRRGSSRLRTLSAHLQSAATRLQSAPTPETAPPADGVPEAVHALGGRVTTLVQPLAEAGVELDRRALWAEIADQLAAGYSLTGAQLSEFMVGLRDGSLVRYAEPWQAELAGEYLGRMYHGNFTDPAKLRELVTLLNDNGEVFDEQHGAFFSGFIHSFGPENVAHISRVIQAMEWPRLWNVAYEPGSDPYFDAKLMQKLDAQGVKLDDGDAENWLLTFGMVVGIATSTGQLNRYDPEAEEKIAYDPDTWGTAQLLNYKGAFGATFLRDMFQNGVVGEIGRHPDPFMEMPVSRAPIGANDGFTTDTRALIMDALERNPHGAALALSTPVPKQFLVSYLLADKSDPVQILYEVGSSHDDGDQLARVYTAAVDWFHNDAQLASYQGDPARAADDLFHGNSLTLSLAQEAIHGPNHLDALDGTIADDLIDHHLDSLFDSAGREQGGSEVGYVDTVHGNNLVFTIGGERDLLKTIAEHNSDADTRLLDAAAGQQAQIIYDGTSAPYAQENGEWVHKVAAFTAIEMNAHDLQLDDAFEDDKQSHELIFKLAHGTVGLLAKAADLEVPGASLAVDLGIDRLDEATAPSQALLDANKGTANGLLLDTMNASLASGYYDHGLISHAPSELLVDPSTEHGPLKDYTALKDPVIVGSYHQWMYENGDVLKYTDEPLQTASAVMERIQDKLGAP
jgi:hypothetical protein